MWLIENIPRECCFPSILVQSVLSLIDFKKLVATTNFYLTFVLEVYHFIWLKFSEILMVFNGVSSLTVCGLLAATYVRKCPLNWKPVNDEIEGDCVFFSDQLRLTHTRASMYCEAFGAQLVTVDKNIHAFLVRSLLYHDIQ